MKRKLIFILAGVLLIASVMFAEYRYIMHNVRPYIAENNTVYLEVFGQVDEYYAEHAEREE